MQKKETQRKEPNMAFMPTSNDSLYSPVNGALSESQAARSPTANSVANISETAILSPVSESDPSGILPPADHQMSLSPRSMLPERRSVGSASQLPSFPSLSSKPSDNTWFDLYQKLRESHATERALWDAERQQLLAERQQLLEQLGVVPRSILSNGNSLPNGTENDKIFYNAATVKHANDSLRKLSIDSNRSHRTSIGEEDEVQSSKRRVSIAAAPKVMIGSENLDVIPEDDPYSPPATGQVASPPPSNYIMNAGHTPMVTRSPRGSDSAEDRPNPRDVLGSNFDGLDEDKALISPKMLPTELEGDSTNSLATLDDKLAAVAEHPERHPLEASSGTQDTISDTASAPEEATIDGQVGSGEGYGGYRPISGSPGVGPPDAIHDADVGVKLKKKRSSNFGAPFGKLS